MNIAVSQIAFTALLKQYREEKGLSRAELATRVKKSPQYIAALENPRVAKTPSVETLALIVKELELRPEERYALVDALLGIQSSPLVYNPDDLLPVLRSILRSECTVSKPEISWLIEMQSGFDTVMSPSVIQALLKEKRGPSA